MPLFAERSQLDQDLAFKDSLILPNLEASALRSSFPRMSFLTAKLS